MKKTLPFLLSLLIIFGLSQCKKKDSTPAESAYDVLVYEPTYYSGFDDQLQATIMKSDLQLSTFGALSSGSTFGPFNKTYMFNTIEKKESFMLYDGLGEPAFLYEVDLATGLKKESVVEFERIDGDNFFVRFFYYDWTNRLGTLLFESRITKSGDSYSSNPTFVVEQFNTKNANAVTKSGNTSFPVKLARLEQLMRPAKADLALKNTNDGITMWKASFDNLRNSNIADWLVLARKAGGAATLAGLGLSETVIGASAGAYLVAGGSTLIVASTALEVVLTDKWSDFVLETQQKIDELSETATNIAGNSVQKFQGYAFDLKEHWLNTNISKTYLDELTVIIEEEELIVQNEDLNDLPDTDGVLQIGLSWNTDETDVDLWVTDPMGERIYYSNPNSASGGYLDRDDTDGFGPENIYWVDDIPDGTYLIQVHYYSGTAVTNYEIKVTNGLGFSATFNNTLTSEDQLDNVITITKSGSQLSY